MPTFSFTMKTLSQEELSQLGLQLYSVGICENIREEHLDQLKDSGEWLLAEDEIIVADETEQKYLYIIVEGEVEIFKFCAGSTPGSDNERQVFSTLDAGNCFGEMAFLSAGVASANVSARGRAVIWRMSHEMLLNYVENCKGGSQLVLNIAASLSGRVQEGNRRLLDVTDRMGAQILKMKNEGQGNLDEMEKTDWSYECLPRMEASKRKRFKTPTGCSINRVCGLLFGAWKFFEKPLEASGEPSVSHSAPVTTKGH